MKNINYVIALAFIMMFSCSDDFTDVSPQGVLPDEALSNADGVGLLLTGAYSALDGNIGTPQGNGFGVGPDNWWSDVASDDAHKGSTDGDQQTLFQVEVYDWQTGNDYFLGRWRSLFAGVNRSNAVISLVGQLEAGGSDISDLVQSVAEARFLRGYYNFELQKMYGNVPFISEENFAESAFNQPNPGPIWSEIEADFAFAVENLPENNGGEVGRANSWSAKSFLGKAFLYQDKNAEALEIFRDIIDNGPYSLLPEFVDNFRLAGENGSESIFAIQYTADDGQSFNGNISGTLNFPNPGPFGSCCGFYQPTQDLVNAYQTGSDGLPLLNTFNDTDVKNDFGIESSEPFTPEAGNLDPRLDYTVGRRGIDYNGYGIMVGKDWIRATTEDISGPYLPKKNVYHEGETANQGTGAWGQQHSGVNYHVIRYADVLLMAAEAAVEENNLPLALNYVNQVRARAKSMTYEKEVNDNGEDTEEDAANYNIELYASFPSQDFARKAVRFERRLELAMEGHRLFDLRRYGNAQQVLMEYVDNETRTITSFKSKVQQYQDHFNVYPIPLNAIDLSGNILSQNPNY